MALMNRALTVLACLMLVLVGCKSSYEQVEVANTPSRPQLDTKAAVYVALAGDFQHKKDFIINSGRTTSEIIRDTFAKYARRAYIARRPESFAESLETARNGKCAYLVYPTILHWEDHTTELTGIPDRIEVKIEITDTATGNPLHATVLKGRGSVMTDGGDRPQDLLPEPVSKYVASLFQVIHTPSALEK
jgi:hypothetical protein